jgi:hypothetical protein
MVQCCGSPQVDIHYYSPAAFVGVCRNCKAKIRNENPGFPLEIKTGQNLVGDEGMIQMIQDLTKERDNLILKLKENGIDV